MKDKLVKIDCHQSVKQKAAVMAKDLGLFISVFCDDALIDYMQKMKPEAQKRKIKRMELNGSKES